MSINAGTALRISDWKTLTIHITRKTERQKVWKFGDGHGPSLVLMLETTLSAASLGWRMPRLVPYPFRYPNFKYHKKSITKKRQISFFLLCAILDKTLNDNNFYVNLSHRLNTMTIVFRWCSRKRYTKGYYQVITILSCWYQLKLTYRLVGYICPF